MTEIESRVAGIPCLIRVTHFESVRGSYSYNAPSDMDYYGYSESEWEVLDRRGRPAAWQWSGRPRALALLGWWLGRKRRS